ncbi:protein translocase subunit SecD [Anaerofustis stercorihominis]|uniref:protein translocase subunit SecD n=1 Tax=Anaerofustis stercorihominis TaxID=214853 RepID=UPI00214A8B97|nr:protein translocase subunit SecD [Anaerofustis stercorihominis]MCR2033257.1 protein translocase subunit SecD [Anaerofustis stercorihominis]
MKKKNGLKMLFILVAVAFCYYVFMFGLPVSKVIGIYDIDPIKDTINYGLDLTGGVNVVLQAKESDGNKINDDTLDKAVETIRTRIDSLGVKEPTISKQGNDKIRVSIPDVEDQEEALSMIGKTAKLQFVGPDGKVILDGSSVKSAKYEIQKTNNYVEEPVVSLTFDDKGAKAFADATSNNIGKVISIELDGEKISTPTVQSAITDGKCVITGMKDGEEATKLATLIKAGSLPVELEAIEIRTIGPTLGADSLNKSLKAGVIGVGLVFLFMIVFYLLPGVVADISLAIYIVIYLFLMSGLGVTLTLPGIAGIILSIGMAVDSNVIIFERMKEELRSGKTIMGSIEAGFSRALTSIIDANITTIIAGLVLFFLGAGTIKGFALTLMVGVVVSMFTAVFVTKKLMILVTSSDKFSDLKLFGIKNVGGNDNE